MAQEQNSLEPIQQAETVQLTEVMRSEIDIQISTAKRYPRSIEKFRQEALSMATLDKDIAASCFYKLKRGKGADAKIIEGPSVRLAEIVANAWGNLRFGARTVQEGQREVVAQGVAHDLEKNVCNTIEVSRRITNSKGERYGDDMIGVTKNAANSIALRNAIFKTVPFTYVKTIYEQAKKVAVGDSKTLLECRQSMLEAFAKMSVTKEQVLAFLEKPSVEDIGLGDVELMIGTYTAIKDGDTTIDQQFPSKKHDMSMPKPKAPINVVLVPGSEAVKEASANLPEGWEAQEATENGICRSKNCTEEIKAGAIIAISTSTKEKRHLACVE